MRCSGEAENVYINLWQIYSIYQTTNFIRIGQGLRNTRQKHFGWLFVEHNAEITVLHYINRAALTQSVVGARQVPSLATPW